MSWKEVLTLPEAQVGIVIYNYVEYLKTSIAFLQNIKTHFHIQYIFFWKHTPAIEYILYNPTEPSFHR